MARTHKRIYAPYTDTLKTEAVRLASQPGIRTQDVAQSLDIHPFMLSRWKKQCREGIIMTRPSPTAAPGLLSNTSACWIGMGYIPA